MTDNHVMGRDTALRIRALELALEHWNYATDELEQPGTGDERDPFDPLNLAGPANQAVADASILFNWMRDGIVPREYDTRYLLRCNAEGTITSNRGDKGTRE